MPEETNQTISEQPAAQTATSSDNGLNTRYVAYKMLVEVLGKKAPLDQTLSRHVEFNALEGRERGLARMIVATALRRKNQIDTLIQKAQVQKPGDKVQELRPTNIYFILYTGIAQLLFMDVPDHAAVDVTVRLTEHLKMPRQKGLINALLRRIGRDGQKWLEGMDEVQANMPQWLLEQWVKDYGLKSAAKIAENSLKEASTDITVKGDFEQWRDALEADILPTKSLRLREGGNITLLEGFEAGHWWVQDASAALPAKLFGDLKGKTVIDLCAAPGGKTAQLANAGANVIALDRSAKRMERLAENMERLGFEDTVEVAIGDGSLWLPPEPVDAVLLDAPCSATGTIRRHPDVMHLKTGHDVTRLGDLQGRLLENSAKMVKSGGVIIYCTCSLQKIEGEIQIEKFLENNTDFTRQVITADEVGGLTGLVTPEGDVRILPFHLSDKGGMDGFYIARLVKK